MMEKIESVQGMIIYGDYIKANIIDQSENGDIFALCYIDNGVFHLRIFDDKKVIQDFNINEMFDIIDDTISIPGFFQPFICCCFIDSHEIFCNFFVQSEKNHYNFSVKKNGDEFEISKPLLKV
jgi:hypothetical protein